MLNQNKFKYFLISICFGLILILLVSFIKRKEGLQLELYKNGTFKLSDLVCNKPKHPTCEVEGFYKINEKIIKIIPEVYKNVTLQILYNFKLNNNTIKVDNSIFPFILEINNEIKYIESNKQLNKQIFYDSLVIRIYKENFKPLVFRFFKDFDIQIKLNYVNGMRGRLINNELMEAFYDSNNVKFLLNKKYHVLNKIKINFKDSLNGIFEIYSE